MSIVPDEPAPAVIWFEPDRRAVLPGEEVQVHWRTEHADLLQIIDADGRTEDVEARDGEGVTAFAVERSGVLRAVAYNAVGRAERVSPPIVVFEPPRAVDVSLPVLRTGPGWLGPLPEPLRLRPLSPVRVPGIAGWSRSPAHELARHFRREADAPFVSAAAPSPRRRWPGWPGAPGPWRWLPFDDTRASIRPRELEGRSRWRRRTRQDRT